MQTNQSIQPTTADIALPPSVRGCDSACKENCRYLRVLEKLRAWTARAEHLHGVAADERPMIGELWRLMAEASIAFDHCIAARSRNMPAHAAPQPQSAGAHV